MKRKTHEQFIQEVYDLVGDEYIVQGKYINTMTKIPLLHTTCNKVYLVSPDNFLRGSRCRHCDYDNKANKYKFTYDEVKVYLESLGITLLSETYKNTKTKLKLICLRGHYFETTLENIKVNGSGCLHCRPFLVADKKRFSFDEVKSYIESFDGYVLLSDNYINSNEKLTIQCPKGHIFEMRYSQFKNRDCRCPICNESKGERKISEYLTENNVKSERQFEINECKNVYPLPFDFAIFKDNKLYMLIEYQGQQHFEPMGYFGGEEKLQRTVHNDNIKHNFCKNNNIKLLEIPYWDYDKINLILEKEIFRIKGGNK